MRNLIVKEVEKIKSYKQRIATEKTIEATRKKKKREDERKSKAKNKLQLRFNTRSLNRSCGYVVISRNRTKNIEDILVNN